MYMLLSHGGLAESALQAVSAGQDPDRNKALVTLAGLLAAIIHDYEHEGTTNDFLVKTVSPKAVRYNDKSPNENHHVSAAFAVLMRSECNFLSKLSGMEFRQLRKLVIELVLSTDMAENGKILKTFKEAAGSGSFSPSSPQGATLALQIALKCADLGHLALGWSSHIQWVRKLETEFFAQGDDEKHLGLEEVSFLMDRKKPGVSETQVGFLDFVALPLFRALAEAFPSASPMTDAVESNARIWREVQADMESASAD